MVINIALELFGITAKQPVVVDMGHGWTMKGMDSKVEKHAYMYLERLLNNSSLLFAIIPFD